MKHKQLQRPKFFFFIACLWASAGQMAAQPNQTAIFNGFFPQMNFAYYTFKVNLATCEYCPVFSPVVTIQHVLPNGNVIIVNSPGIGGTVNQLPNLTPVATLPNEFWGPIVNHPNGNIYVATGAFNNTLSIYNPITNTLSTVGSFPPLLDIDGFFMIGNTLYGLGYQAGARPLYEINITNPSASVQVYNFVPYVSDIASAENGQVISSWPGGGSAPNSDFNLYDINTNLWTPFCETPVVAVEFTLLPPGSPEPPCICLPSSAGTPVATVANPCVPATYTADFNSNTALAPLDGIGFILYTNPANPTGSVLFQNSTGVFPFVPPLTEGVPYYVSRVVGPILNGQVNLAALCVGVSPPVTVTWRPKPTLASLTSSNLTLCPGSCTDISASFTGTPPFSIYGQLFQNSSPVSGFLVNTSSNSNTTYSICVPPSAPPGLTQYTVCNLIDQFCVN